MLFDAEDWGMVEVDEIEEKEDCVLGMINPNDIYHRTTYIRWNTGGCAKVQSVAPADMSPEARERVRQNIIRAGNELLAKRLSPDVLQLRKDVQRWSKSRGSARMG